MDTKGFLCILDEFLARIRHSHKTPIWDALHNWGQIGVKLRPSMKCPIFVAAEQFDHHLIQQPWDVFRHFLGCFSSHCSRNMSILIHSECNGMMNHPDYVAIAYRNAIFNHYVLQLTFTCLQSQLFFLIFSFLCQQKCDGVPLKGITVASLLQVFDRVVLFSQDHRQTCLQSDSKDIHWYITCAHNRIHGIFS